MANVLITYYSDYGEVMYEAISNTLLANGNNIMRFNINTPRVFLSTWGGDSKIIDLALLEQIQNFAPDIVMNFNNSLPQNCYEILDKECKICIIDADNPETFWNKGFLRQNKDKYHYLGLQSFSKKMYENAIGKELIEGKNYLYFPPATTVVRENLPIDKNISFIGSNFLPPGMPNGMDFYNKDALKLYEVVKNDYFSPIEKAKEICPKFQNPEWVYKKVRAYNAGQERIKHMQMLSDLGFTFYGNRYWEKLNFLDFELAACHDETPKLTLEENQWVYNTSKISINISHPQARTSFSWRVMDIMASGACLLTEDKEDWRDLFEKYLSEETVNSVLYKNRFDMREKAITLLNNEDLRLKCVDELNYAIEQNGRWKTRYEKLADFLQINLADMENTKPQYIRIKNEEVLFVKEKKDYTVSKFIVEKIFRPLKLKRRIKQTGYLSLLLLAQIPILDLFFNRKSRVKIRQKIDKYWR